MADRVRGTRPPRRVFTAKNGKGKHGGASTPVGSHHHTHTGGPKNTGNATVLNPPFDPRMRRIGSPLNQTTKIRRGWIQDEQSANRVNFLYNPSELDLSHSMDPNYTANPNMAPDTVDPLDPWYTSPTGSLSVGLLYDRTYELFSKASSKNNMANKYGVFADVAAWYTFLKMYDSMPADWRDSIMTSPQQMVMSYLYIGPTLVYYGYVQSLSVTYTHWSQFMVPVRCSVNISFGLIPQTKGQRLTATGHAPQTSYPDDTNHASIPSGPVSNWSQDFNSDTPDLHNPALGGF